MQNEDKEENTELAVYQQTRHFVENDELLQVMTSQARRARTWLLQKLVCIPETISLDILTFYFILGNRRIKDIKQKCCFLTIKYNEIHMIFQNWRTNFHPIYYLMILVM